MQYVRDVISFSCVGYTLNFVFRIFDNQKSDFELEGSTMCLSQLDQITVRTFCIYCCEHKIRRSDALRVFVTSILSLISLRIFVCLLFPLLFLCFCFLCSA